MGLLDKVKGLVRGNKDKIEHGVDTASRFAKDKLPDKHDAKVDKVSDAVKDQINKIDG